MNAYHAFGLALLLVGCQTPPSGTTPPVVQCAGAVDGSGADGGFASSSACLYVSVCVGDWVASYPQGTCGANGTCTFASPPSWVHCEAGCRPYLPQYQVRCRNPGPTAP